MELKWHAKFQKYKNNSCREQHQGSHKESGKKGNISIIIWGPRRGGAGAYPSRHWARGGIHLDRSPVYHRDFVVFFLRAFVTDELCYDSREL